MLTLKQFETFFQEAELTKSELMVFMNDAKGALKLGFPDIKTYYLDKETQYCLKTYTTAEYEIPMLSGLHKILTYLKEALQ